MASFTRIWLGAVSICYLTCSPFGAATASETAKVMIVLDASGSMWGQVGGKAKISIAREVIGDLVEGWNEDIEIGLSAYGHRVKGDCNDIETIYPVSRINKDAIVSAVERVNPRGKTPLSEAVRRAAIELRYTEDRATVVVISDGLETCNADPCAVGRALEEAGVEFTAHIIGFDLTEEEQSNLRCLAENTGGEFIPAKNAEQLKQALATTVKTVERRTETISNISVDAKANVFGVTPAVLADGQPPTEVQIPEGENRVVTFTNVTGTVSCCAGAYPNGPEGLPNKATNVSSSHPSLSGAFHGTRVMYLAGVFVGDAVPGGLPPQPLRYTGSDSEPELSPLLNQVFFIGDGLTGNGSGPPQRIVVPQSAARVLLGFADAFGFSGPAVAYSDNTGGVTLNVILNLD